jgi:1,4-dihydroxy-2-naphthoyl-CoA hydrolase
MPSSAKVHEFRVTLHDVDAGGILFFAHLFRHAHDAYEAFMADIGHPLDRLIRDGHGLLPLVHAEADYHSPLRHGQDICVHVSVAAIGNSSFTLDYRFVDDEGRTCALARTVHAHLDRDRGASTPLPRALGASLAGRRSGK